MQRFGVQTKVWEEGSLSRHLELELVDRGLSSARLLIYGPILHQEVRDGRCNVWRCNNGGVKITWA